jgi:hypothetical protein
LGAALLEILCHGPRVANNGGCFTVVVKGLHFGGAFFCFFLLFSPFALFLVCNFDVLSSHCVVGE